jgi:rubredoxin
MTSDVQVQVKQWGCLYCGYVYDEAKGCPESAVGPGTPFDQLPEDWCCPMCSAEQTDFQQL